jgi:hypothetical protein
MFTTSNNMMGPISYLHQPNDKLAGAQHRYQMAARMYREKYFDGKVRGLIAWLSRRSRTLLDLNDTRLTSRTQSSHYAGLKTIRIDQIRGTEGRSADFDKDFLPLKSHNRQRWVRVAEAFINGTPLPPVELIQVKRDYYVRDGHHRISVARALGQEAIEATVTVLDGFEQKAAQQAQSYKSGFTRKEAGCTA